MFSAPGLRFAGVNDNTGCERAADSGVVAGRLLSPCYFSRYALPPAFASSGSGVPAVLWPGCSARGIARESRAPSLLPGGPGSKFHSVSERPAAAVSGEGRLGKELGHVSVPAQGR